MVDKPGLFFGTAANPYDVKSGSGFVHDGSIPNLLTFLSISVFNLTAADALDLTGFMLHFPTETRPSVGRHVTCPQGPPPQAGCDEAMVATLTSIGDLTSPNRQCELTATALSGGRTKSYRWSGGAWLSDVPTEPGITTATLRTNAQGPISFLCATLDSGLRLGGDRDEDGTLNGVDCAPGDASARGVPVEVAGFVFQGSALVWAEQATATGPGILYDVVSGTIAGLRASGLAAATSCLGSDLTTPAYTDARPAPTAGQAYYYLVRAVNSCGSGGFGPGRTALDTLACP
jgi:hypothetical protein